MALSYLRQRCRNREDRAFTFLPGRKRVYLGVWDSEESKRNFAELVAEQKAKAERSGALTVGDLIVRHMAFIVAEFGKGSTEHYHCKYAWRVVRELYSSKASSSFGPKALQKVRDEFIKLGWSRQYINQQTKRLVRAFGWAVSMELYTSAKLDALRAVAPLRKGRTKARETKPVEPVDSETIEATVAHCRRAIADMIQIQRLCGMRPGELCDMRPDEIKRQGPVWLYQPYSHKNGWRGKSRTIPIGPQAQALLLPYLFGDECFDFTVPTYRQEIHRSCRRAGIPIWSPNRLRHTRAVELSEQYDLETAKEMLGHSSQIMTRHYGGHNLPRAMKAAGEVG